MHSNASLANFLTLEQLRQHSSYSPLSYLYQAILLIEATSALNQNTTIPHLNQTTSGLHNANQPISQALEHSEQSLLATSKKTKGRKSAKNPQQRQTKERTKQQQHQPKRPRSTTATATTTSKKQYRTKVSSASSTPSSSTTNTSFSFPSPVASTTTTTSTHACTANTAAATCISQEKHDYDTINAQVEEHFRRSLGANYELLLKNAHSPAQHPEAASIALHISIDNHHHHLCRQQYHHIDNNCYLTQNNTS